MRARRITLAMTAVTLLSVCTSTAFGQSSAAAELMRARSFCMGCTTATGRVISGDHAFISILRRRDAVDQLQAVFAGGNMEAKMYALAGLREIDHSRFEENLARMKTRNFSVVVILTEDPHSILRERGDAVLKHIREGQYRTFVQWARTGRVSP